MFRPPPGERIFGVQLPIQQQSAAFVQGWEPAAGPPELARVAQVADELGYAWLGASDHVVVPANEQHEMGTFWADCVGTLSWVAGLTRHIRLLSYVYVLPLRHPAVAAKQFATLDWLSQGRAVVGLGAGHLEAEFGHLGVDFGRRGRAMDDGVARLADALEHEYVDGLGARPRPVQQPRPPIWISGSSAPAVARAGRLGDGWIPQGPATPELVDRLHRALDDAGRPTGGFAIGHIAPFVYVGSPSWELRPGAVSGSPDEIAAHLRATMPAAVNQIQVRVCSRSVEEMCDQLAAFAADVAPLLRAG